MTNRAEYIAAKKLGKGKIYKKPSPAPQPEPVPAVSEEDKDIARRILEELKETLEEVSDE